MRACIRCQEMYFECISTRKRKKKWNYLAFHLIFHFPLNVDRFTGQNSPRQPQPLLWPLAGYHTYITSIVFSVFSQLGNLMNYVLQTAKGYCSKSEDLPWRKTIKYRSWLEIRGSHDFHTWANCHLIEKGY